MCRLKYHFTPPKGWINDPNGLICVDGVYHLFYQHYPESTQWGPMHWGHAISRNLLTWEHLPIALFPTDEEYIFSGSAILDIENISGLGKGKAPLLLFYTSHNPKTGEQQQSMAYSLDYVNFIKYEGNPIIGNLQNDGNYRPDFRDPKVFPNKIKGGFSMALACGKSIRFYHSRDFFHWECTGEFYPDMNGRTGICECPDVWEMDGISVLTLSIVFPATDTKEEGHLMQYYVGEFQGDTFVSTQKRDESMVLDHGKDNYACVTFGNCPEVLMLGWGEDWNAARVNQAVDYFGKMTLARRLSLINTGKAFYIKQEPVTGALISKDDLCQGSLESGEKLVLFGNLMVENKQEYLEINQCKIPRCISGNSQIIAVKDQSYYEIFADGGLIAYSVEMK